MTSGRTPTNRGHMTESEGRAPRSAVTIAATQVHSPRWPFVSALACGVVGVVANVFLVGFFTLGYPSVGDPTWGWLGFVNDVIGTLEFLLFLPVIVAVTRLLPASRAVGTITGLALAATSGLVLVSIALVVGAMPFDVQVRFVIAFLVALYGWLLAVNSIAHRANTLPRSVTRFGLLLGASFPAALLLILAGLLTGGVDLSGVRFGLPGVLLAVPGLLLGFLNWLALPGWPLLLAGTVFRDRPTRSVVRTHTIPEKEDVR